MKNGREDKYTIEWTEVNPDTSSCKPFEYATITITELWSIGHLVFTKPLVIEVYLGENDEALIVYDFGMEDKVPTNIDKNFLHNYGREEDPRKDPILTVFSTIKFDLMHAFFHYNGDPNYGHTHWALIGHLKDRSVADDSFIWDDIQEQEKKGWDL